MKYLMFFLLTYVINAQVIELKMANFNNQTHKYMQELLEESLKLKGYKLVIKAVENVPQSRIDFMLKTRVLDMHWYLKGRQVDKTLLPVKIGLTNGLIGKRVLFIRKGEQARYDKIYNLEDLQKSSLVGAFGKGWYDVKIWEYNKLKYYEQDGDWTNLFKMISSGQRKIDYLSRGVTEILYEYPSVLEMVDIEEKLLLDYDGDFIFYLNKDKFKEKIIIEEALTLAKQAGLIDKLIDKYYAKNLEKLNYKKRKVISLKVP